MTSDSPLVQALWAGHKVRIAMPETDGLDDGREVVRKLQALVPFRLCYLQRLGADPALVVWRSNGVRQDMQGYESGPYPA